VVVRSVKPVIGTFGSPRDICAEGKEETKEESKVKPLSPSRR
jgi:hypothetical protein